MNHSFLKCVPFCNKCQQRRRISFDFHPSRDPPGPQGTRGALGVRWIKKLHKTENDWRPILAGVPFIKNVEIPKFLLAPWPAPPSGPVFSGRGPKIKIPLPTFCLPRCPDSEKVQHDPPAPKPPEEIDLVETRFFGVRA